MIASRYLDAIAADPVAWRSAAARMDFRSFIRLLFRGYDESAHIRTLTLALQTAVTTPGSRTIVTMPPRHSKSLHVSEHLPAWYLGKNPDKRVIAASHSAHLAYTFSRRVRNLFSHPLWPFPDVRIAGDKGAVAAWDIAAYRGGYVSVGVGGSPTGLGADVLIIDDPIRSAADADSETIRDGIWRWYQETMHPRLQPDASIIVTATRWHEDDLTGRLLVAQNDGGEHWDELHFPAINDDGDALWPSVWPLDELAIKRAGTTSRAWEAQYQGRPAPAEGALLKREWWQHYRDPLPPFDWLLQSWDTAFKKGSENDYSACVTAALAGANIYILDVWRDRVEFPDLKRTVRNQFRRYQPDEIMVEDAGSGQSLIQEFRRDPDPFSVFPEPILPLIPFKPDRDKLARVNAISSYVESGHVYLPAHAPWVDDFVTECASFPTGKHDDQVDALSMAVLRIADRIGTLRGVDPHLVAAFVGLPG